MAELHAAGQSAQDPSRNGQRCKLSFCFQLVLEDPQQNKSSCSSLWNGPAGPSLTLLGKMSILTSRDASSRFSL